MNRFLQDQESVLEKEASILGGLGMAGLIHVAPNVAMKTVKTTETGNRALAGAFSAGVNHGKTGRKLHPNVKSFMEYGVGPESLVDYNIGSRVGKGLRKYEENPQRQDVYVDRIKKKLGMVDLDEAKAKEIKKTPILGSVYRHFNGEGSKRTEKILTKMSVPEDAKKTLGQRAGNAAMLAGAGVAEPHLLLQPAFSAGRKQLAKTEIGKNMLRKGFESGVDGKVPGKIRERLTDTLLSPGVLDTQRVGNFLNKNVESENLSTIKGIATQAEKKWT